ncbi:methyltransferase [Legionella sainthelensi]|uniref:Methyltransferase n=1 Tax=Legionella sainthelensi TaxID=28087 RepID=A0A0W0YN35_9GAMM|nr:class I SAM-dependent methyltransferase [Legionella sainthelensi]KTD58296.1 methyltransferase [Legionella sainthelensi]VEH27100.1 methyltransferase [Legionella sainthelensi]
MKKCLSCSNFYPSNVSLCQYCEWAPELIDGFCAFSPQFAQKDSGFKVSHFAQLAQLEANNFWFRTRNKLIIWALNQYCPVFQSFFEIGCGTGYVLSGIADAFPGRQYKGGELFIDGLSFAATRQNTPMEFMQMDARHIPFVDEFDVIGAFDVLEHIQEDMEVLLQMNQALKPNGLLLLTVPQHQWLWSNADKAACHVRRYSAKNLHDKIQKAGFKILRSTSFVFFLLPLMIASRFKQKLPKKNEDPYKELRLSPWLNAVFEKILEVEVQMIRKGLNFSLGGSRLIVAKK